MPAPPHPSHSAERFTGDLTAPPPIPPAALAAAQALMRDGALFRYGEQGGAENAAAALEAEFAESLGARYCVAVNSGGSALFLALKAAGIGPGDRVLINAFTLAPAVSAIVHVGAQPVLVDITPDLVVDTEDLRARAPDAQALLLSYMRGHLPDMDAVMAAAGDIPIVEDCAHATGATWAGRPIGRFGVAGCFSAQGYKHLNAGEGGFIVTDDADLAARAILMSGSYMLYAQHRARPEQRVLARWAPHMPNFSMRMTGLAAALLRPQIAELPARVDRWRGIHARVAAELAAVPDLRLPTSAPGAAPAPTSLQFTLDRPGAQIAAFLDRAAAQGVAIKWFGRPEAVGFTSRPDHWAYAAQPTPPTAARILANLCDIRLPLALTDADAALIGRIVARAAGV
ncbi:MAG: DegT/DnrJ/EryC1/StrS family aminotransferase [Pseudomonadota bacterium]